MENSFHDLPGIFQNAGEVELENHEFKNKLIFGIKHLLETDLAKLVNILYRIDIEEAKVNKVLNNEDGIDIASGISDLIIQRQMEKIRLRKKYSEK